MSLRKIIVRYLALTFSALLLFSSCKKSHEHTIVNTPDDRDTQSSMANDELILSGELAQSINDALAASTISTTTSGDSDASHDLFMIQGAVIDTDKINIGLVKIIYYGKNNNKTKGYLGNIEIQHGMSGGKVIPWKTKGASAVITYKIYEVFFLHVANPINKIITFNGTCMVTNITGGLLKNIMNPALVPGDSIVEQVQAKIDYTYNDETTVIKTWPWGCNQIRIFKGNIVNGKDTSITYTMKGDTAINNINNISSWGESRSNQNYYTSVTTPAIRKVADSARLSDPVIGRKIILGNKEPVTITYGVDKQGTPISANDIPYGYIITWTNMENQAKQAVIGYYR